MMADYLTSYNTKLCVFPIVVQRCLGVVQSLHVKLFEENLKFVGKRMVTWLVLSLNRYLPVSAILLLMSKVITMA